MPSCCGMAVAMQGLLSLRRALGPPQCATTTQQRLNKGGEEGFWLSLQDPQAQSHKRWRPVASSRGRFTQLRSSTKGQRAQHDDKEEDDVASKSEPLGSNLLGKTNTLELKTSKTFPADWLATTAPGLKGEHPEDGRSIKNAEALQLTAPSAATGSVFGAMALITGSSVGAGILALPAITAPTGFIPSAMVMSASWAFLVLEALLLAEVNVALMQRRETGQKLHSEVLSLRTMADQTMGPLGGIFTTVTYLVLSYTLLVAYIAKSGEVLSLMLNVPIPLAGAVFTFGFGGLLCVGGTKTADSVNQVLTIMLIGLFLLIVIGGASMADWTGLKHADWTLAPQTLPIIFLALVYHDLTPVLCAQLGGDMERIRKSIVLGSLVPLAMFLSWDAVALCLAPLSAAKDPIDILMRVGGPGPAFVVEAFALLAVATSFIGTVLGLSEFLLEQLGKAAQSSSVSEGLIAKRPLGARPIFKWLKSNGPRALSFLLVLAPPFAASSVVSDAFFSASDLAGAYGMTSLYGVIPPAMAWSLHHSGVAPTAKKPKTTAPGIAVPGGKLALASIGVCAVAVILGQVVLDLPQIFSSPQTPLILGQGSQESSAPSVVLNCNYPLTRAP